MLPHRKKRLQNILLLLGSSFIGIFLILTALNSQLDLFYSPSELNKNNLPQERIKLGGMVKKGSIKYEDTKVLFVLTDFFVLSCISSLPEVNKRISITSERYLLN